MVLKMIYLIICKNGQCWVVHMVGMVRLLYMVEKKLRQQTFWVVDNAKEDWDFRSFLASSG
jgi:hypothetical protein